MTMPAVRRGEKSHPVQKTSIYNEFILWSAMPPMEQKRLGIETQKQFCEFYGIGINRPTIWKNRPDFQDRVRKLLRMWGFDKTPGVIQGIYQAAVKGNSDSQRLWLSYFEGYSEKTVIENQIKVVFGLGDIRNIIEKLPENLKQKHYGNLRELLDDAVSFRESTNFEADDWTDRPALEIPRETDQDASDVSDQEQTDELAKSYKGSLCADMVRQIPQNYNQSSSWRWEEQSAGDYRI